MLPRGDESIHTALQATVLRQLAGKNPAHAAETYLSALASDRLDAHRRAFGVDWVVAQLDHGVGTDVMVSAIEASVASAPALHGEFVTALEARRSEPCAQALLRLKLPEGPTTKTVT